MQHFISVSIYALTLAWITSENSTKLLECKHLKSIFFAVAGPSLLCPFPWFHANSLCCPVANCSRPGTVVNCLPAPLSSQLSFASPYHFRIRRDFRSKNPLSGFAPKQTKESSALAGHPYSATVICTIQVKNLC